MNKPHPKVVLTAYNAAGVIVQELELTPYEWYDEECALHDSDEEIRRLSVRTVEGYQTDEHGRIFQRWRNTYDAEGRPEDSELLLHDWRPTIPPPPPGQSAAEQLRRMGLFPPRHRSAGIDSKAQPCLPGLVEETPPDGSFEANDS